MLASRTSTMFRLSVKFDARSRSSDGVSQIDYQEQ